MDLDNDGFLCLSIMLLAVCLAGLVWIIVVVAQNSFSSQCF